MAASLALLPVELFENILVHTLSGENPSGQPIASLSQTCRYFYNVVYHPDNSYMWCSLFLAVWDDPSRAVEWRSHRVPDVLKNNVESGIDWKEAFINRMDARRTFGALSSKTRRVPRQETIRALRSALDALSTICPSDFRDGNQPSHSLTAMSSPWSTFFTTSQSLNPELVVRTGSLPSNFAAHLHSISLRITELSKNSGWISSVVLSQLNGASQDSKHTFYPSQLLSDHILSDADNVQPTSAILASEPIRFWNRKVAERRREEGMEAQLFSQLIFLMGSGPISTELSPVEADGAREPGTPQSLAIEEVNHGQPLSLKSDYNRALQRARARVYDIRYFIKERSWGPFQIHDAHNKEKVEIREWNRRQQGRRFMTNRRVAGRWREDFLDDPIWTLAALQYSGLRVDEERDGEGGAVKPGPHQYEPDFAHLAACRIVIEAGLCRCTGAHGFVPPTFNFGMGQGIVLTTPDGGEIIKLAEDAGEDQQISVALEMLRAGSVPGYQGMVLPLRKDTEDGVAGGLGVDGKGQGTVKDSGGEDRVDGWDWAGVEGEWRRVICSLHFWDILLFNMQQEIPHYAAIPLDLEMSEFMQMMQMKLKITHYTSPPPLSSGVSSTSKLAYQLPVIHFEDISQCPDPSLSAFRTRVWGCVRMCEGGWVRWSLSFHYPDGLLKGVSENIQIGDIGSAMGFIGLWIRGNYIGNSFLGPGWAWKIS